MLRPDPTSGNSIAVLPFADLSGDAAEAYFCDIFAVQAEIATGDGSLCQQAEVLAQWGDPAGALAALERARAVGDGGLVYLATDPLLDPIRDDPRFRRLLTGLPFA